MRRHVWARVTVFLLGAGLAAGVALGRAANTPPLPPVTFTQGDTQLTLTAERQPTVWNLPGDCMTVRWATQNIAALYLNDAGVVGEGEQRVCAGSAAAARFRMQLPDDTTHTLDMPLPRRYVRPLLVLAGVLLAGAVVGLPPVARPLVALFPGSPADTAHEILPLTSLRALGAALVVFFHYPPSGDYPLFAALADHGYVGVAIFFVLSGFLITARYYAPLTTAWSWGAFADYYTKRVARIYPLYFFVFLLTFVAIGASFYDARAVIFLLLLQDFFTFYRVRFIGVAWTLTVEFNFYFLAPFIFLMIQQALARHSGPRARALAVAGVLAAWVVGLLALAWWLPRVNPITFGAFLDSYYALLSWTLFGRFFEFAVGIALGLLYLSGWLGRVAAHTRTMTGVALAALAGIVLVQLGLNAARAVGALGLEYRVHFWGGNYAVGVLSALLITSLLNPQNPVARGLAHPFPVYLGRISYAVYLLHLSPLMAPVTQLAEIIGVPPTSPLYGWFMLAGANVLAVPFYEWIEKPARHSLLTGYTRFKAKVATAG